MTQMRTSLAVASPASIILRAAVSSPFPEELPMPSTLEGGCACGAVRYRIDAEPLATVVCHCTDCQVQSGGAFSMTMVVRSDSLKILSGIPKSFLRTSDSGNQLECFFCPDCGARLYNDNHGAPGAFNVKPGTLDDRSWLQPVMHVWVRSKQPWVPIPDGAERFDENPG